MAWLWTSWEDYVGSVHPVEIQQGAFRSIRFATLLEIEGRLLTALSKVTEAIRVLDTLGFGVSDRPAAGDPTKLDSAFRNVECAVFAGEELLLYHKRLAVSEDAYEFLQEHNLLEHWDRYAQTKRIYGEIERFVAGTQKLLDGYYRVLRADERFIVDDLDLPHDLAADFRQARDLFSLGLDDIGLLVVGRGLEGVLRRVALDRKILLEIKGKANPACEADFADIIETLSQVRWQVKGVPLISKETKNLLHFLRAIRNSRAHPQVHISSAQTARDTAEVVAREANEIWRSVSTSRARLSPTTVQKSW